MIVFTGKWVANGGGIWSRAAKDWRSGSLVSVLMIICGRSRERATARASSGSQWYLMSAAHSISQRHPHALRHSFVLLQTFSETWRIMEPHRRCSAIRAVITQRYLHDLDGQMAACFERLKFKAATIMANEVMVRLFSTFSRHFCSFITQKRIDRTLAFCYTEDSLWWGGDRRHQRPLTLLKTRFI